jgi:hypothetical protein
MTMLPRESTRASAPGGKTTVVTGSSMIAGPLTVEPAPSSSPG